MITPLSLPIPRDPHEMGGKKKKFDTSFHRARSRRYSLLTYARSMTTNNVPATSFRMVSRCSECAGAIGNQTLKPPSRATTSASMM
jgi:hypothetical protein